MKRAFTLIELLVSITLIMILAALLFPVFSQAKDRAKEGVCISNLRQIYGALKLYQADYDEYPPSSFVWPGFKPYYPTLLECPASTAKYPEYDYDLRASGGADKEGFLQCRELRGPLMPLSFDWNHWRSNPASGRILVLRETGSVEAVATQAPDTPCGLAFQAYNR